MNPALRSSAAHVFVDDIVDAAPSDDDLHHLLRVLRLRDGEVVTVSDGRGAWRTTEVAGGALRPTGDVVREPAPTPCTIATAVPKGDRLEWMVQKLTELGVSEIVLVDCARSVVRWDGARAAKQLDRLARIAREASSQSRRVWLPAVRGPLPLAEVLAVPGVVLAEPDATASMHAAPAPSVVVIGPEGGFSEAELALGTPRRRLTDTVLRIETAAIAAACALLTTPSDPLAAC